MNSHETSPPNQSHSNLETSISIKVKNSLIFGAHQYRQFTGARRTSLSVSEEYKRDFSMPINAPLETIGVCSTHQLKCLIQSAKLIHFGASYEEVECLRRNSLQAQLERDVTKSINTNFWFLIDTNQIDETPFVQRYTCWTDISLSDVPYACRGKSSQSALHKRRVLLFNRRSLR